MVGVTVLSFCEFPCRTPPPLLRPCSAPRVRDSSNDIRVCVWGGGGGVRGTLTIYPDWNPDFC